MEGELKSQTSDDGAAHSPTKRPRGESDEADGTAVPHTVKRGSPEPSKRRLSSPLVLRNPDIGKDDHEYPMCCKEKSVAIIFNHRITKGKKPRTGTDLDAYRLQETFQRLNFDVRRFDDEDCSTIMKQMKLLAEMDHTNRDCIAVIVLTHGHRNGKLAARDVDYEIEDLLNYVIPRSCPTLAGKPKLFFIQACRGDGADAGVILCSETDNFPHQPVAYQVASYADILISNATFEGQCAMRNKNGSWYIQTLCDQLGLHATQIDLLTLLTRVNRIVNQRFRSQNPDNPREVGVVQAPSFTSSLTRCFRFSNTTDLHN